MNPPLKALMYAKKPRGEWRLFVGTHLGRTDEPGRFPGVTFPSFPKRQQRIDALRELGFAPVSVAPWQWDEDEDEEYGLLGTLFVVALVDAAVKA